MSISKYFRGNGKHDDYGSLPTAYAVYLRRCSVQLKSSRAAWL